MKKKALAFALVLCMVIAMLPVSVFAAPVSERAAPLTATNVGELAPAAVAPNAKSYSVKISKTGKGTAELLVDSPAQVGSEVYFLADPDDGYLAEVYVDGIDPEEVFYLGADMWGFIMPGNKVTLNVEFVAAEGKEHRINVVEYGSGDYYLPRDRAKQYESVLLAVLPNKASEFVPEQYVFTNSGVMFYLFEEEGVHYYELIMGDEDVAIGVAYKKTGPLYVNPLVGPEHSTITWTPQKPYFLDTVTVTIVPDPGYRLVRAMAVSHAGDFTTELTPIGGNKYTFTMHADSVELYVTFEEILNPVTVKAGVGGTAKADVVQAKVGDTVTVTCTPDEGYKVASITGNVTIKDKGDNRYTFTMPEHDVTIDVTFKPIYNPITVTVETGLGGTATLSHEMAEEGDTVTLTATPEEGYRVAQITGVKNLTDNGDGTYTFPMPDEAVNIKVLFLRHENPFLDVNETHFFYAPVLWAVENGITSGMSADTFGPMVVCNRAQVVTFLWRYAGSPEPTVTENPFTDVPAGSFYEKPVLWAVENGITKGVSPTLFGPNMLCNRAQVVTFLWRIMEQPTPGLTDHPFTDVDAGSFYEQPVLWALENGITTGATATTFNPVGECLRAQVVTFLYRTAQLPPPPVSYDLHWNINGFTDTPSEYGTVTLSHTNAQPGETVTATVIPAEGYQLDWAKCYYNTPVTKVSDTEYTFVMPDHEEVFCVNFSAIPVEPTEPEEPTDPKPTPKTYELVLKDNGHGTVSYVDATSAAPGESIFFYAVPDEGYYLERVGIFNPDNSIDVSMIRLYEHEDNLYELVMINHDIIMTLYFSPIPG